MPANDVDDRARLVTLMARELEADSGAVDPSALVLARLEELAAFEESRLSKLEHLLASEAPRARAGSPVDDTALQNEVDALAQREQVLLQRIDALRQAHGTVDLALAKLVELEYAARAEAEANAQAVAAARARDAQNRMRLAELSRLNVLNMSFHVWTDGAFVTVNGLRLGGLPDQRVDHGELNAGLGMAAQLLEAVARDLDFASATWKVVPRGDRSHMLKVKTGRQAPLHYNGGLWVASFNEGVAGFASLVGELGAAAVALDPTMPLPHAVEPGGARVAGLSLAFAESAEWARAVKFLLTDLKWLEAVVVRVNRRL